MKNWETFQTAYQAASEEIKKLIDSEVIPNCIKYQVDFKTIDESHQQKVVLLCSHSILGTMATDEITKEMQSLGIPNAGEIFSTLQNCMQNAKKEPTVPAPPPPADLASEIEEAEAAIQAIPKVKTMAQDAQAANMYSSSQEALLKDRQPKEPS